ncbi:MAG: hypothetical protein ACJA2S_002641 [Cyclobacteriaceae bacterium]|jgi:hypothetical protein
MKRIFLITLATIITIIFWTSFSQDTVDDLAGDFKEMAFFRNENNTGPIIRKYAVSLTDTLWQEMEQYGQIMPYTKYGTTTVFYFLQGSDMPQSLNLSSLSFDVQYQPSCVGKFERNATGVSSFTRYPFRSQAY